MNEALQATLKKLRCRGWRCHSMSACRKPVGTG